MEDLLSDVEVIRPERIAKALNKSLSWVYAHAEELGGARIGGSWIFTVRGLKESLENATLRQGEKEMARDDHGERAKASKTVRYQGGSKRLGGKKKERNPYGSGEEPGRFGIADAFSQILGSFKDEA